MASSKKFDLGLWSANWKSAWKSMLFRVEFFLTFTAFAFVIYALSFFFLFIEARPGALIEDPVLNMFISQDVTWITFTIIYLSVVAALVHLSRHPRQLLITFNAYIFLVLVRMVTMYLTPLDPPAGLILLEDPFVESVSTKTMTRDLYFSGHTSTLFLLYLTARGRLLRTFFLINTILVALAVLVQHVHYSVDVVAAFFYSFTSFKVSCLIQTRLERVSKIEH
jgi:hypothetical protein